MDEQKNEPQFTEQQLAMIDQGLAEYERDEGVSQRRALRSAKARTSARMNFRVQRTNA